MKKQERPADWRGRDESAVAMQCDAAYDCRTAEA